MARAERSRPVFFDLRRIAFPATAVVSIGHRVSGIVLALAIPALVWLFGLSLSSPQTFATAAALLESATARVALVVLAWALAHHSLAGVRHLLFDIHLGTSLRAARLSAWTVFGLELVIVLLAIAVTV